MGNPVHRPPKSEGRDHIARLIELGQHPGFNPITQRKHGKYMCSRSIGGCGHKHSWQPGQLCDDCAGRQAGWHDALDAQEAREAAAKLARRQWGEAWEDLDNWRADHALIPPRTPREHADRQRAEEARQHIPAEQRARTAARQWFPWEERAPFEVAASATTRLRDVFREQRQAAADSIEIGRIQDPSLREMLKRWRVSG